MKNVAKFEAYHTYTVDLSWNFKGLENLYQIIYLTYIEQQAEHFYSENQNQNWNIYLLPLKKRREKEKNEEILSFFISNENRLFFGAGHHVCRYFRRSSWKRTQNGRQIRWVSNSY
jgi:hypothetical protein